MASNTKYKPENKNDYTANGLQADYKGISFTATAGQVTTFDFLVSDDVLIDGAVLIVLNGMHGDKLHFQVVDKDNVLGFGNNVVLAQYITDWYVNEAESFQLQFESPYPAKLPAGVYLRTIYPSIGAQDAKVIINYKLHRVIW